MKLTLTEESAGYTMVWNLEKDIGDMRLRSSRKKLYRELIEEIDHHLRYSPPPPEMKSMEKPTQATSEEVMKYLAALSQEEREEILK
jgi:hypothetical protein